MDIDSGQLLINGTAASSIILALVWALGVAGVPDRWKPLISDGLGLLGGIASVLLIPPPDGSGAFTTILLWVGAGILASGYYSQFRTVADV